MSEQLAEADRRIANVVRVGTVKSVDPATATAVVNFGDFDSPPIPVGQLGAGAIQFWWMPSAGEQVLVTCEGGDIAQGIIVSSIYAGNAPSQDGSEPQMNLAGGRMVINGTLEVTGDVIASGISLVTHTHPESIGSNTGGPN